MGRRRVLFVDTLRPGTAWSARKYPECIALSVKCYCPAIIPTVPLASGIVGSAGRHQEVFNTKWNHTTTRTCATASPSGRRVASEASER